MEFGSFKHFLLMIGVPTKISAQLFGNSPWIQSSIYYRRHKTRHKHIFLQHGATKNDIPGFYGSVCKSLDLFVCGAKPEYEYIRDIFDYRKDGFGEICVNKDDIVKSLITISNNGFKMNDIYLTRVDEFFTLDNKHNCDRVYKLII